MTELALRVVRLRDYPHEGSGSAEYYRALAELYAACRAETIIGLAKSGYLPPCEPLVGVDAWVWRAQHNVRELVRSLWRDYAEIEERFERQRQTIRKANFAAMARMGEAWHRRKHSEDPTEGLADMIGSIADERDGFKQMSQRLSESNEELRQRLEGFRDVYTDENVAAASAGG